MKLYIPEIGDQLTLSKDWEFSLHDEYRNHDLLKALGFREEQTKWGGLSGTTELVSFPIGTVLKVDRIYIKKGNSEYSSLSFRIVNSPLFKIEKKRFWAKLKDCNLIEFTDVVEKINVTIKWDYCNSYFTGLQLLRHNRITTSRGYINNNEEQFEIETIVTQRPPTKEEFEPYEKRNGMFSRQYKVEEYTNITDIKYNLTDSKTREPLGTYKTLASAKKKARDILINQIKNKPNQK